MQKVGAATAGLSCGPEKSRKQEVGTSPSAQCGQEGRSALGKAVEVEWGGGTILGVRSHRDPSGEEQSSKMREVHSYRRVLVSGALGRICSQTFRQHAYQWKLVSITLTSNKKIKLNCFEDTIIELYTHLQFEWK